MDQMKIAAPVPRNEKQRLARLHQYKIFNEEPDDVLIRYVRLAAEIASTPFAFISLVDSDRQRIISSFGVTIKHKSRYDSICAFVVFYSETPFLISDLSQDPRFCDNPNVVDGGLKFYGGFPLDSDGESAIGSLCVMDTKPRVLSEGQIASLTTISHAVMTHLKFRQLTSQWENLTNSTNPIPPAITQKKLWGDINERGRISDLERAITQNQFVNYYQPKINLKNQKITGAEALVRWKHPIRGIVEPRDFIPLLEKTGLILDVGQIVLEQAMKDWRTWRDAGLTPPQIAVNVAAQQLTDPNFLNMIQQSLNDSGAEHLNPLSIELTESSLLSNREEITSLLLAIRSLGVPIALDDFGTGYSNLSYLVTLPIDVLKIDRSFVTKMAKKPEFMGIVSTIISLAHSLGFKVVAEGVETTEEANLLRLLRCEQAQGFLYSKPVPAEAFVKLLGNSTAIVTN